MTGTLPRYKSGSSTGVKDYVEKLRDTPIQPVRKLAPEVDPELAVIVEKCLAFNPEERIKSFDLVREDLRRRRERKPLFCRRPWKLSYLFSVYVRRPSVQLLIVGLILLSGILGYRWYERREELYTSHLLKGLQANGSGRYEQAYIDWAQALEYREGFLPMLVRLNFRPLERVFTHPSPVLDFELLAGGKQVVTAEESGRVSLWNTETGSFIREWTQPLGVSKIAVDPGLTKMATAGFDGVARIYDLKTAELLAQSGDQGADALAVEALEFSSDGRYLVHADYLGTLTAFDILKTGSVPLENLQAEDDFGTLPLLATHPTKPLVAALADMSHPGVWDLTTGKATRFSGAHESDINQLAWLPGASGLLTGDESGVVQLWDQDKGNIAARFAYESPVSVLLPLSSESFAVGYRDGSVRIWHIDQAEEPEQTFRLRRPVLSLDHHPVKALLAVGTGEDQDLWSESEANGTISVFSLTAGYLTGGPWPSEGPVKKVKFLPEVPRLVSLFQGGLRTNTDHPTFLRIWNYVAPEESARKALGRRRDESVSQVDSHTVEISGVKVTHGDVLINDYDYSAQAELLVTVADDWSARFWEPSTGEAVGRPFELRGPGRGAVFSPGGDMLATASQEGEQTGLSLQDRPVRLRLWDVENSLQLSPILTCPGEYQEMSFNEDGSELLVETSLGTYRWSLLPARHSDWKRVIEEQLNPTAL